MSPTATVIVAVIVGLVLIGIVWAIVSAVRSTTSDSFITSRPTPDAQDRLRPKLVDFHVKDTTARIYYGVPLPDGDIDDHLKDLLCHDAPLVLHEKRAHGLPIEQVIRAEVFGQRGGQPIEVGVLELEEPGEIPEVVVPDLVPHAAASGYDPLAQVGEQEFDIQPGVASDVSREGLPPFSEEITFAQSVEAGLRAIGVDPYNTELSDLSLALLRIGGYQVSPAPSGTANTYFAQKAGSTALIVVHEHERGEHPELSEHAVNAFVIAVALSDILAAWLRFDSWPALPSSPY